jgi:hypothetical protein
MAGAIVQHRRVEGSRVEPELLTYCSSLMPSRAVTLCVKRLPTSFSIVKSLDEALELGVVKERGKGLVAL